MGDGAPTIRLLGPVLVEGSEGPVPSRSAFGRTLLALLAVRAGEVVPTSTLIDELWGDALPQDPRAALQVQATRLRKWLAAAHGSPPVRHDQDGYRLEVAPEEVDLHRFLQQAAVALDTGAGDAGEVRRRCDAALATWTGEPFTGCAATLRLAGERVRATELRLQLLERRAAALLDLGDPDAAIASLAAEQAQAPEREGLTRLLLVGLHRAGRQREALQVYEAARRHVAEEFGLEPGPALTRLHARVLTQDPALLDEPLLGAGEEPARPPAKAGEPVVVERDHLLAVLRPGRGEPGRLVVVTGEAGAGKSTLLRAAARDAARRGVRVGAGGWDDSGTPMAAWDEALAALGRPRPATHEHAPGAVRTLLAGLALESPVLVALDDAQLADSMSLGILRGLARGGIPAGVCIAVTARDPDVVDHASWSSTFADLARLGGVEVHRLGPLTGAGVQAVLRARLPGLDEDEADRLTGVLVRRTAGHPLHVVALLDAVATAGDEAARHEAAGSMPDRLRPLLAHQLSGLPDDTRALLDALAVSGPAAPEQLAALAGTDALGVLRAIRPAEDRGLVEGTDRVVRFRHHLTEQAVLESMAPVAVAHLHRACLALAPAEATDPFDALRHAEGAGELVGAEELAAARVAAARAAYGRGAVDEAAALAAQARAEVPDAAPALLAEADLVAGLALTAQGRPAEAAPLLDRVVADAAAPPALRATAAVGHRPLGLSAAGDAERLERLRAVLPVADQLDPVARFDLLRSLALEETLVDGATPTPWVHEEVEAHLRAGGGGRAGIDRARLLVASARLDVERPIPCGDRLASAEAALEAASRTDDPYLRLDAVELVLSASLAASRLEPVEDLCWLLDQEGAALGRPRARWSARLVEATLLLARGEAEAADRVATAALELGADHGIADALGAYGVFLAARHHRSGDLHAVGDLIDQACAAYPRIAAWPATAALAAVHAEDLELAARRLAEFRERRAGDHSRYFDRTALCLAAEAAAALGDREAAEVVLAGLPPDPDAVAVVGVGAGTFGPIDRYVALAEWTVGAVDDARRHAGSALALAERLAWPPWVDAAREVLDLVG